MCIRHHRAAIHLLEVADRHLARTKAVETDLVLEVHQAGTRLRIEVRCGDADLEFVLQSLDEGFCDLHGVNLLPAFVRPDGTDICQSGRRATSRPASVVRRTLLAETGPPVILMQTPSALGAGGGTRTPTTFVTGT